MTMAELRMKFQYDPKLSLGTIVETLTLLLAAGTAYVNLTNVLTRHEEQIKNLNTEIVRVDSSQKQLQADVRSDLKEIKESVTAIRLQQAALRK